MKTLARLLLGLFIAVCIVNNIWHPSVLRGLNYERLGTWHECRISQTDPIHMACREGEMNIEWGVDAVMLTSEATPKEPKNEIRHTPLGLELVPGPDGMDRIYGNDFVIFKKDIGSLIEDKESK